MPARWKFLKRREGDIESDSNSDNDIVIVSLYCGLFRCQHKTDGMARPLQKPPPTTATITVTSRVDEKLLIDVG